MASQMCVGDKCVWGDTLANKVLGRMARAKGSRANGPVCVGRHMCGGKNVGGPDPRANG